MAKLDEIQTADPPYSSFEWQTDPLDWDDFIQNSEGYQYQALGLVIGNEVYVDPYGVHRNTRTFTERVGYDIDDLPEHSFTFKVYDSVIAIHRPYLHIASGEMVTHVAAFVEELGIDNHHYLKWMLDENRRVQRQRVSSFLRNANL